MIYRTLGRTGLKVSQLGFGAMRLPMIGQGDKAVIDRSLAIPMLHKAFEAGVNYVDTAVGYCNQDSQRLVGEALKGWRDKIIVSTKNPYYGNVEKEWWKNLEDSLQRLAVDSIDIYNHHGINWKSYNETVAPHMGKWMLKAREQGLIKHICCSFHDNNDALRKIIDTGYVSVITLQYNMLDRQLEDGIAYAHARNVGIVVMGPVAGGRLGASSQVMEKMLPGIARVPELAMRFVLANPNVSVALSGMSTMQQVEENIRVCADATTLSAADVKAIHEHLEKLKTMADLYCTGCGYCKPCPSSVDIPRVFEQYNRGRVYGFWDSARGDYANIGTNSWDKGKSAADCSECGACEEKCPQKLPIRRQLKEAHEKLSGKN